MANIALNKTADASNYVYPYQPAKAVDGVSTQLARWVGSSPIPASGTPSPVWLRVDLGAFYWINRWVIKQMGSVGWLASYNLTDYKLQGSLDNVNWFDIDSVVDNSANSTDRACTATKVRWARIYVTKGLRCNTNFASIVDLELYAPPYLSNLVFRAGRSQLTLSPAFTDNILNYSTNSNGVSSITVTPTAEDSSSVIKVNGEVVVSGQTSGAITLVAGSNIVTVEVSSNTSKITYSITVTN